MNYGVSNGAGQTGVGEAARIVCMARAAGCVTLDTAIAYGDSERCLGQVGVHGWEVVSKLPAFTPDCGSLDDWVAERVAGSLERLGLERLDALLLHAPWQLLGSRGGELTRALNGVKMRGLVRRLGISIYSGDELEPLLSIFTPDIVQAPFNVIDRGLETSGWATLLQARGVEIHLRSVFLQGLLLMEEGGRPPFFDAWSSLWQRWHAWLRETGLSALQASLSYATSRPFASRIVVGVTSEAQLAEILSALRVPVDMPPDDLQCGDDALINPSQWKLK